MYKEDYTLTLIPHVHITFDKKGNIAGHSIDFGAEMGWLIKNEPDDLPDGVVLYPTLMAAEEQLGKIIYGSVMEYVDTLALTQMYYNPDDDPF